MTEPETIRARIERIMAGPPKVTIAAVQKQVVKMGGPILSYTHCANICRGSEQQGERAEMARIALCQLVAVPYETLFAGLVIRVDRTVGADREAPVGGVSGPAAGDSGVDGKA